MVGRDSSVGIASYTMGTGSFPEVKRPGRVADHPPPYCAEVKEGVQLYFFSTSGSKWPVIGRALTFALPLPTSSWRLQGNENRSLSSL
jgi:hypothetical protein